MVIVFFCISVYVTGVVEPTDATNTAAAAPAPGAPLVVKIENAKALPYEETSEQIKVPRCFGGSPVTSNHTII
jgi:hypothetical protein